MMMMMMMMIIIIIIIRRRRRRITVTVAPILNTVMTKTELIAESNFATF